MVSDNKSRQISEVGYGWTINIMRIVMSSNEDTMEIVTLPIIKSIDHMRSLVIGRPNIGIEMKKIIQFKQANSLFIYSNNLIACKLMPNVVEVAKALEQLGDELRLASSLHLTSRNPDDPLDPETISFMWPLLDVICDNLHNGLGNSVCANFFWKDHAEEIIKTIRDTDVDFMM